MLCDWRKPVCFFKAKDALSPKLMQLPEGAFSGFFGSALMPPNEEAAGGTGWVLEALVHKQLHRLKP